MHSHASRHINHAARRDGACPPITVAGVAEQIKEAQSVEVDVTM
jgi:hypothetical protein